MAKEYSPIKMSILIKAFGEMGVHKVMEFKDATNKVQAMLEVSLLG